MWQMGSNVSIILFVPVLFVGVLVCVCVCVYVCVCVCLCVAALQISTVI